MLHSSPACGRSTGLPADIARARALRWFARRAAVAPGSNICRFERPSRRQAHPGPAPQHHEQEPASWKLNDTQDLGDYYVQIRKLKRQGERLVRQSLAALYKRGGSTQELLPLHDVSESIRHTIALQERAARIADLLRIKDA